MFAPANICTAKRLIMIAMAVGTPGIPPAFSSSRVGGAVDFCARQYLHGEKADNDCNGRGHTGNTAGRTYFDDRRDDQDRPETPLSYLLPDFVNTNPVGRI